MFKIQAPKPDDDQDDQLDILKSPRLYKHNPFDKGPVDFKRICSSDFIKSFLQERGIPCIPITELTSVKQLTNTGTAKICLYDWLNPASGDKKKVVVKKFHACSGLPEPEGSTMPVVFFLNEVEKICFFNQRRARRLFIKTSANRAKNSYDTYTLTTGKVSDEDQKKATRIIQCYGYCFEDAQNDLSKRNLWMVIEYAERGAVTNHLSRMNLIQRVEVCLAVAEARDWLFGANGVHGDIKSLNVLWCEDGFKLADFGTALAASEPFYLLTEALLKRLQEKAFVFFDYTPIIISMLDGSFWFVLNSSKQIEQTQQQDIIPEILKKCWPIKPKAEMLYVLQCPELFKPYVADFFDQHPMQPLKDIAQMLPFYLPQDHKVMQYLRRIGYHQSILAQMLQKNSHIGSYQWLAPDFMPISDISEPSDQTQVDLEKKQILHPTPSTDTFSTGVLISEIFRGKTPYPELPCSDDQIFIKVVYGLRPSLESLYTFNDFCATDTLWPTHRTLAVKKLIEACWAHDPNERPPITDLIHFFKSWLDEIIIKAVTRNRPDIVQYFLQTMPDLSWCLTIREFQDIPADLSGRISLLQATVWSCNPIALVLLESENVRRLQSEIVAQLKDQNLSIWIEKNGPNAIAILEQLLHLYQSFSDSRPPPIYKLTYACTA